MGVVRKEEGKSQPYPLTHRLPSTQTRTGISCLHVQEIPVREWTKHPQLLFLQWLVRENFRTRNSSDGLEYLGRALDTHQVRPPHWKFQLRPTKILVKYANPIENPLPRIISTVSKNFLLDCQQAQSKCYLIPKAPNQF